MEYEDIYARYYKERDFEEIVKTKDYKINLCLPKFSDESVNRPCSSFDCHFMPQSSDNDELNTSFLYPMDICTNDHHFMSNSFDSDGLNTCYLYPIDIYKNGISDADADFIAIVFRDYDEFCESIDFACTISVIDMEKKRRFIRSFCFYLNNREELKSGRRKWSNIVIDRYLARKTLFEMSMELLPNDILTLCIELHIKENHLLSRTPCNYGIMDILRCFNISKSDGERFCLNLNSPLGEKLAEASNVFREMIECTNNGDTELFLPNKEDNHFICMADILLNDKFVFPGTADEIIDLYIFADKYDVPVIIECARNALKYVISENNIFMIWELADKFSDDELLEHIKMFQEAKGSTSEKYVYPPSPVESDCKIPNFDFYK